MKKLIVLATALLMGVHSGMAQGSVQYQNAFTTAIFTNSVSTGGTRGRASNATTPVFVGLFYSDATTGGTSNNLTFATAVGIGATPGVISGSAVFGLPGTAPTDQVWLMVLTWSASLGPTGYTHYIGPYGSGPAGGMNGQWDGAGTWFGQSPTILLTQGLGAVSGPGTPMFQNDATHIGTVAGGTDIFLVPEPSTFALAGLGAAAMLIFRRRK